MYLSLSVGCGMRLHASFATHTLKIQEEVYFSPHTHCAVNMCVCVNGESFNLKPQLRIYYIYIFTSGAVFIMYLHLFP